MAFALRVNFASDANEISKLLTSYEASAIGAEGEELLRKALAMQLLTWLAWWNEAAPSSRAWVVNGATLWSGFILKGEIYADVGIQEPTT